MSLKEFISDPKLWIATVVAGVSTIWVWLTKKRIDNSTAGMNEAQIDAIRFNLKISQEKYDQEKDEKYQAKINQLNERLTAQGEQIETLKQKVMSQDTKIEELMAEINMYKTIFKS